MEAQRQEAVRIGPFTVQALANKQAEHLALKRWLTHGYQAQSTAHFVICRKAASDQVVLLHRIRLENLDADLLRWLNDELASFGIIASAKDYGALLFAILASPFPPPRDQRAIWRHFCLTTLLRLRECMAISSASSSVLETASHIAAKAARSTGAPRNWQSGKVC